jgi:hypothetical protein
VVLRLGRYFLAVSVRCGLRSAERDEKAKRKGKKEGMGFLCLCS